MSGLFAVGVVAVGCCVFLGCCRFFVCFVVDAVNATRRIRHRAEDGHRATES